MFADVAGQAIAAPALQEGDKFSVSSGRLVEEPEPARAIGTGEGPTAATWLIRSSGLPGRSSPVCNSTVPVGVARRNGSTFQSAALTAKARSGDGELRRVTKEVLRPIVFVFVAAPSVRSRTRLRAQA